MINSIDDSRLDPFRKLKFAKQLENNEIIIESKKAVQRAIDCGIKIKNILTTPDNSDLFSRHTHILTTKDIIDQLTGFKLHSSVLAIAEAPNFSSSKLSGKIVILDGFN